MIFDWKFRGLGNMGGAHRGAESLKGRLGWILGQGKFPLQKPNSSLKFIVVINIEKSRSWNFWLRKIHGVQPIKFDNVNICWPPVLTSQIPKLALKLTVDRMLSFLKGLKLNYFVLKRIGWKTRDLSSRKSKRLI